MRKILHGFARGEGTARGRGRGETTSLLPAFHSDREELDRIAAAYPDEARFVAKWERKAYMTEIQQLAWLIRFDPPAAAEALSAIETLISNEGSGLSASAPLIPHRGAHYG